MAYRIPNPPEGTEQYSSWPYPVLPKRAVTDGPWRMGMSAGGSMVLWPSDEPFPEELGLIEAFRGEKEQLERFQMMFCMRSYETDDRYRYHADGQVWLFNWISTTVSQIHIASQVAQKFMAGDTDGAWEVGRTFETALMAAETPSRS